MWFLLALATLSDGRALFEQNKFTEARSVFERVVQAEPGNHEARYWLGFTDLALTGYEAAILQFERIEQKYRSDPEYILPPRRLTSGGRGSYRTCCPRAARIRRAGINIWRIATWRGTTRLTRSSNSIWRFRITRH